MANSVGSPEQDEDEAHPVLPTFDNCSEEFLSLTPKGRLALANAGIEKIDNLFAMRRSTLEAQSLPSPNCNRTAFYSWWISSPWAAPSSLQQRS